MTREEALQAIKAKMDYYESDKRLRGAIETLIPELCESEDEKIIEEMIDFIQWAEDRGMIRHDYHQAKRPTVWIAYLEKQKEQKPNYCHHEVDETGWTEEYRKAYYDGWNNCNMQHSQLKAEQKPVEIDFEDWDTLGYIRDIVRKHVRKDEEFDVLNKWLTEHYVIQKPAEWSEEDEDYMKDLMDYFGHNLPLEHTPHAVRDWLKSLPERFNLQSKQEWSEEDEKTISHLIGIFENMIIMAERRHADEQVKKYVDFKNRLKSIRERINKK